MGNFADHEIDYVRWQNRASRFYLGARLLHRNEMHAPAAYCSAISCELLLKATLIYWDRSFNPLNGGHGMAKLTRMVKNKAHNAKQFAMPAYFYHEKRYLTVSRYPTTGKGISIPSSFRDDLDKVFTDLILFVPFQHNTDLKRALSGKDRPSLLALRYKNQQMRRLRQALSV
jgi:HEPN domain-containing protein